MVAKLPEPTHQWMHNPDTDGYWECPVALVEMYTARGWEPCEGPLKRDEDLYDDPDDPRLQVASPDDEALVLEPFTEGDTELVAAFAAAHEVDETGLDNDNDVPDDPGNNTTTSEE